MSVNPYGYNPNQGAAMIFTIPFAICSIWHIYIMFRRRVWYFLVLIFGRCLETTGYICRFLAHDNTSNFTLFIVQTLTILVAPALFAASVYMVLGRLILLVKGESYSVVKPSRLTKIFVGGDIICFFVQIIGSGTLSSKFNLGRQ